MGVQYFCDVAVYPMALTNTQKIFRNHIKITPDIKKIYVTKVWLNQPLSPVTSSSALRKLVFWR